jgi:hypothetical protein
MRATFILRDRFEAFRPNQQVARHVLLQLNSMVVKTRMFVWLRWRPEAGTPVKRIPLSLDTDRVEELTRILLEAGESAKPDVEYHCRNNVISLSERRCLRP